MTYGLTDAGFSAKRLLDIVAELEAAYRATFGQGIRTTPDTTFGKLIGIHADREAQLWELAEAVYYSAYPNSASGLSLDRIGELTDVARNPATRSTVTLYLSGLAGTTVPRGAIVAVQDAGDQFRLTSSVILAGTAFAIDSITRVGDVASALAYAHGLVTGGFAFISGADQAEYNVLAQVTVIDPDNFTYAVEGTPVTPATGTIQGDPATPAAAESSQKGPVQALDGTLTDIVNPVVGWDRAENALDADLGADAESDAAFRARRLLTLRGLGAARQESILGALLTVDGVTKAIVFVNDTDSTVDGRPPHSIECLVVGGDDQEILDMIWNKKAAGIQAFGTDAGTVVDSQGDSHAVSFTRVDQVEIYLELDLTVSALFPADGQAQVLAAVLAFGEVIDIAEDVVVYPALVGALAAVPGITGVAVRIGTAVSPTLDDNIAIGETQTAVFDSSRIEVAIP